MERGRVSRFRGVIPRRTGKWGAQVTVDRKQLWLGTYETEVAAATAYDRASLKLCRLMSLNFPWTTRTQEIRFQGMYPLTTIISMIKNGTYAQNYASFRSNEASLVRRQCLARVRNMLQSLRDAQIVGIPEVHNPVMLFHNPIMLFGARIG